MLLQTKINLVWICCYKTIVLNWAYVSRMMYIMDNKRAHSKISNMTVIYITHILYYLFSYYLHFSLQCFYAVG